MEQKQFLNLSTAEEAEKRFWSAVMPNTCGEEQVCLHQALRRVLARDVIARHNVPYFDRSNFDGYAVHAEDTFGAKETAPVCLSLNTEVLACGVVPQNSVTRGTATMIATGGVIPRGANAVVMIENTLPLHQNENEKKAVNILKPVVPTGGISLAGSDIGAGEVVFRVSDRLGYRETGTLAALGEQKVWVWKRPKVGIISTGDELIAPGEKMELGKVYDSNSMVIAHAVEELGCEPQIFGIIPDNEAQLERAIQKALYTDFIILSGGTSKGEGDLNYRVFEKYSNHGILVHGVSLKPGKPLCLAILEGTPAAILPGFPASATFTYSKFIEPILRKMSGLPPEKKTILKASVPARLNSDKGRTEFHLVHLVRKAEGFSAYSTGKGSGSITGFARADGFIEIPRNTEMIESGQNVTIQILGEAASPPDLMLIGSHCVGLDYLMGEMQKRGVSCRFLAVGSMGGLMATKRGECDISGIHLMDADSGIYNEHLISPDMHLQKGYRRSQGLVFRKNDKNFADFNSDFVKNFQRIINNSEINMINRNRGSGTRVLLDHYLVDQQPSGFFQEAKSHNSVAAAISQKRADWGFAIRSVAEDLELGFIPIQDEEYDFVIPNERLQRTEVEKFISLLEEKEIKQKLADLGLKTR